MLFKARCLTKHISLKNSVKTIFCLYLVFFLFFSAQKALADPLQGVEEEKLESTSFVYEKLELNKNKTSPVNLLNRKLKKRNRVQFVVPTYSVVESKDKNPEMFSIPSIDEFSFEEEKQLEPIPDKEQESEETTQVELVEAESEENNIKSLENVAPSEPQQTEVDIADLVSVKSNVRYDYDNTDTALVAVHINNQLSYDFEIIIWPDGHISLPVKTLAELLDVSISINHVHNSISFDKPDSKAKVQVDYKNNKIIVGVDIIEPKKPKMILVEEGFLVEDDVFISAEIIQYLFDIKMNFDEANYVVDIETKAVLKALAELNTDIEEEYPVYEEALLELNDYEKENKLFKLKQVKYSTGTSLNRTTTAGASSHKENTNMNLASSGNLLGGQYNVGAGGFYSDNSLDVGNFVASLDYIGSKYETSFGSTDTRLSDLVVPSTNILGARFGSLGAVNRSISVPRFINGRAADDTYVELFINDIYTERQSVLDGRFEFESINPYSYGSIVKIRVEEVSQDNTRKIVYDRSFSQDNDLLASGQQEFLMFSGYDSAILNNRFNVFGENETNRLDSIKLTSGVKYAVGITDTLTTGINFANDLNIRKSSTVSTVNSDRPVLSRSSRSATGYVGSMYVKHVPLENLKLITEAGFSDASSRSLYEPNSQDVGGLVSVDYKNKEQNYNVFGKLFYFGPDFYTVGHSSSIDKKGGELNWGWTVDKVRFSGNINRYNSNLDRIFTGGESIITNMSFNVSGPIKEGQSIRMGIRSNSAENTIYKDNQVDLNLTLSQQLFKNTNLVLSYIHTLNKNDNYNTPTKTSDTNNNLNVELDIDVKKLGLIRISNKKVTTDSRDRLLLASQNNFDNPVYKDIHIKLDRSRLPIKGVTVSPNIGYKYGNDKGISCGVDIGFKLGKLGKIVLKYMYNSSFSKYLAGGTVAPSNNAHTVSVNLVRDINFGLLQGAKKEAGNRNAFNPQNSIIKGVVYLDLNQNGIRDKGEEGLEDIDLKIRNMYNITTDSAGKFVATNLSERRYVIGIDEETLPVLYTPTGGNVSINVKKEKVYIVNFGVIVTPGSISGKVNVDEENEVNSEIIILLLDEKGKEIKYTTTDSRGEYYLEALPPGTYTVIVDQNYLDYKGLQAEHKEGVAVEIPLILDDFVDIENIDFKLIEKKGELKTF